MMALAREGKPLDSSTTVSPESSSCDLCALFQGLIRCADCGHMVTWQLQKGRYYGHCQRSTEACKRRRWLREDRVEAEVIRALEQIKDPDGKILEKIKAALEVSRNPYVGLHREKVIEALHRQLNRLEAVQEKLYEDKLAGLMPSEVYDRRRHRVEINAEDLSMRLVLLYAVEDTVDISCYSIADLYLKGDLHGKRVILGVNFIKRRIQFDAVYLISF